MSTWRLSSDDNGTFRGAIFRLRRSVDAGRGNERRRRRAVTATDDANHRAVAALSLTRSDAIRPPGRPLRSRPADICNACRPFSSGPTRSALGRSGWRRTRSDQLVGRSLRRVRTSRYGTCDVLQCGFFVVRRSLGAWPTDDASTIYGVYRGFPSCDLTCYNAVHDELRQSR